MDSSFLGQIENTYPKQAKYKMVILGVVFFLFVFSNVVCGQASNSAEAKNFFNGSISATNNGVSLIPSFNLGKPAIVFDLSLGKGKFSFDPQLRFAMEGKPWSFIFWWRYSLIENGKFALRLGAHPALSFKEINVIKDGADMEIIRVRRYLAAELAPAFKVSKNITVSPYYLYAHGVESDLVQHTQYIALLSSFSNFKIAKEYYVNLNPQLYYLKMDKLNGFYFASSLTLARKDCPFSASGMINKIIDSEIASKNFIWSISLIYSFGNRYVKN